MKTIKLAPFSFALIFAFIIHLILMWQYFNHQIYFEKYFWKCAMTTFFYLILSLFSFGFFVYEPLQKRRKKIENSAAPPNWWWAIYWSVWLVLVLIWVENNLSTFIPDKIIGNFTQYSIVLFIFKGIFLFPIFFRNQNLESSFDQIWLKPIFFLEILLIAVSFFIFYILANSAPEFGE